MSIIPVICKIVPLFLRLYAVKMTIFILYSSTRQYIMLLLSTHVPILCFDNVDQLVTVRGNLYETFESSVVFLSLDSGATLIGIS